MEREKKQIQITAFDSWLKWLGKMNRGHPCKDQEAKKCSWAQKEFKMHCF